MLFLLEVGLVPRQADSDHQDQHNDHYAVHQDKHNENHADYQDQHNDHHADDQGPDNDHHAQGHFFCWECLGEAHAPATCSNYQVHLQHLQLHQFQQHHQP